MTKLTQPDSAMAPKMRGSLTDTTKSKARAAAKTKKKVVEDEKKMFSLQ